MSAPVRDELDMTLKAIKDLGQLRDTIAQEMQRTSSTQDALIRSAIDDEPAHRIAAVAAEGAQRLVASTAAALDELMEVLDARRRSLEALLER